MTGGMRHLHENRRRHYRAKVSGRAVIHHGHGRDGAVRCEIDNLSLGGVALRPIMETPDLPEGTSVAVELQVDGASWVVQSGQVQRRGARALVITFAEVSPELEDLIEDEVLAAVEAERSPRVVVVDRSEDRRSRVAAALSEVGWCPLEASTPLEAIELIEQSRTHVAAAAVARSLTQTGGQELVHFLHESHPEIKLALITEDESMESVERAEVDAVLCADGRTDLSGPVRRLVGTEPPPMAPRKL